MLVVVYKASTYKSTSESDQSETFKQPIMEAEEHTGNFIKLQEFNLCHILQSDQTELSLYMCGSRRIAIETRNTIPMTPFRVNYSFFHELNQHFDVGVCLRLLSITLCLKKTTSTDYL